MDLVESTNFFAELGLNAKVVDGLDNGMKGLELLPKRWPDVKRDYFGQVAGNVESRTALLGVFEEASFLVLNQHIFNFWQRAMAQLGAPSSVIRRLNNRMINRYGNHQVPIHRFECEHSFYHRDGGVFESVESVPKYVRVLNHMGEGQVDSPTLLGKADQRTTDFIREKVSRVMIDFEREIAVAGQWHGGGKDFFIPLQKIVDADNPHDLCNAIAREVSSLIIWINSSGNSTKQLIHEMMGFDDPRFSSIFHSHHYAPTSSLVFPNWLLIHGKRPVHEGGVEFANHNFFMPFFDLGK